MVRVVQSSLTSAVSAGRVSAVADVVVPVGGAVGGALLISSVLDSLDSKSEAQDQVKPTQEQSKRHKEEEDEDDGAL